MALNHLNVIEYRVRFHVHLNVVFYIVVHVVSYGTVRRTEHRTTLRVFLIRFYASVIGFFLGIKTALFNLLIFPCNFS